jgi:hypothetical protein
MTTQAFRFVELSSRNREKVGTLSKVARGDKMEVRLVQREGKTSAVQLPPEAAELIGAVLAHLASGKRVAVVAEDQELSPNEASTILGMSRPMVVHRMDVGDLPFRYVGKHRRAKLSDVLSLKQRLDTQRSALQELAEETEMLIRDHGL